MNLELYRFLFTESDPNGAPLPLGEAAMRAKGAIMTKIFAAHGFCSVTPP